jgi:general secretion pathway protein I
MMRQRAGFTLLEVLIALAIVTLSVGALLGAVTSSASNISYLRDKTLAEWVALNRITEIRVGEQMPDKGSRSGTAEMGGQRWQWQEEVTELPVKGMFRIDVRVRSLGEGKSSTATAADNRGSQVTTETTNSASSEELKRANWLTIATGVMGTAQSQRRTAVATTYGDAITGGPGDPGKPRDGKSPPGSSPKPPPGTPSQ